MPRLHAHLLATVLAMSVAALAGAQVLLAQESSDPQARPRRPPTGPGESPPRAAPPESLRLGDPAPPLPSFDWVRGDARAAHIAPGETVVLEFWATWCPTSRALLARQDSLLAVLPSPGLRIIALAPEPSAHVAAFADEAGWTHLAIACDPAKQAFAAWAAAASRLDAESRLLPVAFVIHPDAEAPGGRIVWMGQPADPQAAQPLAVFDSVLAAVCAGTYDLAGAIAIARQEERSVALFRELFASDRNNDLDRLEALLAELPTLHLAPGYRNTLAINMNSLAWSLVTRTDRTPRHVAAARTACAIALDAGAGDEPHFVDTYARVLFESGEVARAVAEQTRAVELARGLSWIDEARASLDRYRQAAGWSPAEEATEELPRVWRGSLNSVFTQSDRAGMALLVGPGQQDDPTRANAWATELASIHERFYSSSAMTRADEVSEQDQREKILVLYGTPEANEITREALALHGIGVDSTGVTVGGIRLSIERPVLITCLPNPWNPMLPLTIYTAAREADAQGLNRFFHGPTAFVCGQWRDRLPVVLHALDYEPFTVETNDDLPGAALRGPRLGPTRLALGPESLTSAQAQADLEELHACLAEEYAGYQDLDWKLRASGGSWGARTRAFAARIGERASWPWQEYFDLLREYLDPVQDTHFSLSGSSVVKGEIVRTRVGFIRMLEPYFADAIIRREGQRYLVASSRQEVLGVEPIVSPHAVRAGQAYLFPSLPSQPADLDARETDTYLLGSFALRGTDPESLTVHIRPPGDALRDVPAHPARWPLHRGRLGAQEESRDNWKLSGPPQTPLPVLAVSTMNERLLQGMAATADSLRSLPCVVLDLRWNPGGSDSPALEWCRRFSSQPYEWIAAAFKAPGSLPGPFRWVSRMGGPLPAGDPSAPEAPTAYAGRLFVLSGKGAASSGETFTHLSGQVQGAIVVGQNTAGCATYGNVREWGPLGHSRITLGFGVTKFVVDWVRPNHEGVGFLPDYWLDSDDPLAVLAGRCGMGSE